MLNPDCPGTMAGLLVILLALGGCGETTSPAGASEALSAAPHDLVEVFRLGGLQPSEPEMFDQNPRFLVDASGRLYVLHRARGRVAVFGPDGDFMRWIGGGRGEGPGEFTSPGHMGLLGDTLWIRNFTLPYISRFHTEGEHLGTEAVRIDLAWPTTMGIQGLSGYLQDGRSWTIPDGQLLTRPEAETPRSTLELGPRVGDLEVRDTVLTWRGDRGSFSDLPEG